MLVPKLALAGALCALAVPPIACGRSPGVGARDPITGRALPARVVLPAVVVGGRVVPFASEGERGRVQRLLGRTAFNLGLAFVDTYRRPGAPCSSFLCPIPAVGKPVGRERPGPRFGGHYIYLPSQQVCGCLAIGERSVVIDYSPAYKER